MSEWEIKYDVKFGRPGWKLARVTDVHPGEDGRIQTITVSYRATHVREKTLPYISKDLTRMKIGVQRFAILYTVEEQDEEKRRRTGDDEGESEKPPLLSPRLSRRVCLPDESKTWIWQKGWGTLLGMGAV
jgi:hypothetical protein